MDLFHLKYFGGIPGNDHRHPTPLRITIALTCTANRNPSKESPFLLKYLTA